MEMLLVPVTGDKIGLCVSEPGRFEDQSQQFMTKTLAQNADDLFFVCGICPSVLCLK